MITALRTRLPATETQEGEEQAEERARTHLTRVLYALHYVAREAFAQEGHNLTLLLRHYARDQHQEVVPWEDLTREPEVKPIPDVEVRYSELGPYWSEGPRRTAMIIAPPDDSWEGTPWEEV